MYELIRRDVVPVFLKWTASYGSAVRIWGTFGEPRLLLTDPVGLDYILRKRAYAYPKVRIVRRMLGKVMGFGLLAAEGETHKRQKRAIQPGFSNRSIHKLTPIFQRHAHLLYEHLLDLNKEQSDDALVDIYRLMGSAALDAIGSAAFHIEFNSLARAKARSDGRVLSTHPLMVAFERTLDIATANSMARNLFDALTMIFPGLEKLPIGVESAQFRKTAQVLTHVASQLVQEAKDSVLGPASKLYHKQTEDERPDLLAALLRANANARRPNHQKNSVLDKAELSDNELTAQLSTFLFAGHETTATQMTWLIWALAQNQHIQVKLREEIRALRKHLKLQQHSRSGALDEYRDLTLEELDSLPYLDACVRESLRLHGVVHTTSRMATERDVIPCSDGRRILIEKDTVVMLPLAAISQNPDLWGKDAGTFNPELPHASYARSVLCRTVFQQLRLNTTAANSAANPQDGPTLDTVKQQWKKARFAKDTETATVLGGILTDLQYAQKTKAQANQKPPSIIKMIQKGIKKRADAARAYRQAKPEPRTDLAEKEERQIKLLEAFLPEREN
ncbi:hypothetical protein MYAM1_000712 [Malassezia yamatoensis]|uniref:Altered inheritance of mitochondria protein 41 n=1 Tax=Malassezia yamatoensis TaxID=253288 RepID=A0AAJ6CHM7_9BASI|nr:hypothetical protein MYAM1_000712 [Malassezia yamatoensis]